MVNICILKYFKSRDRFIFSFMKGRFRVRKADREEEMHGSFIFAIKMKESCIG